MKKNISILFLTAILSPIFFEFGNVFISHQHEICNEDGIHYHEIINDCNSCLLNNATSENFKLFQKTEFKLTVNKFLVTYFKVIFYSFITSDTFGRAPPVFS